MESYPTKISDARARRAQSLAIGLSFFATVKRHGRLRELQRHAADTWQGQIMHDLQAAGAIRCAESFVDGRKFLEVVEVR